MSHHLAVSPRMFLIRTGRSTLAGPSAQDLGQNDNI